MAKGRQRDLKREAQWREILARQRQCGLSVRGFCRREGVAEAAFYAWRRTIRQRDGVGDAQRPARGPAFVPLMVRTEDAAADAHVVVELRGGRMLRLPLSMPAAQLAGIVHALEGVA
jgi:transposase